ncbi:MAG: AEC family transporter, partial [Clostridia bacterium]|nr:AEC family transporter [Clostridia bacterium]
MSFSALLSIILTLFLLMICGFFCRKKGIIDTVASKRLSSLIISVGQPMMIIAALNNAEYSKENLTIAWQVTLIGFVLHSVLALASLLICRGMKGSDRGKIFEFSL